MIKATTNAALALRPAASNSVASSSMRAGLLCRPYATQNTQQTGLGATTIGPKRRRVTAFNDDGYVPWNELSTGEKAARASQQTYNLGMILVGVVLTVLYQCSKCWAINTDDRRVVLATSYGTMFSRLTARLRSSTARSTRSRTMRGVSRSWDRRRRFLRMVMRRSTSGDERVPLRKAAETGCECGRLTRCRSSERQDPDGTQHILMHFYVRTGKGSMRFRRWLIRCRLKGLSTTVFRGCTWSSTRTQASSRTNTSTST